MAYVIERSGRAGARFVGIYRATDEKYKSAGTRDSHERAYEAAADEEHHAWGFTDEAGPADKAKMTVTEFCEQRLDLTSRRQLFGWGYRWLLCLS